MNNRNKICKYIDKLDDPKLIKFATDLIVVGGVIFISVSVINIISYTMRKINDITTQLSDIKTNYVNVVDYINDVERCSYCSKSYRSRKCLDKHEYMCGVDLDFIHCQACLD